MPKYKKCDRLKENIKIATCEGNKMSCVKKRLKCHVTATCWKVAAD
jgi:hypothetical protein